MKKHIIWTIFLKNVKRNSFHAGSALFFNLLAMLLEGVSFAFLFASLIALTEEKVPYAWVNAIFSKTTSHLFLFLLLGAIFLQILRSIAVYFAQVMTTFLTADILKTAQKKVFERIFGMNFSQAAQLKKGDLIHQVGAPASFIPLVLEEYNRLIVSFLMILAYLLIMVQISFYLTFLILIFFGVTAFIQRFLLIKIRDASHAHENHIAHLTKQTTQSLDGFKTIHLFQMQGHAINKTAIILDLISKATTRLRKLNALIPSIHETLGVLLVGLSLILGSFFLQKGSAYASQLFTYLTLTYRLGTRLQQVMMSKGVIAYYWGPFRKLKVLLSQEEQNSTQEQKPIVHFENAISFDNVSFKYPHKQADALKNLSLTIPKNSIVALVGSSGAGKSTLIDLLLRLYNPTQGIITIDHTPIDAFSLADWRKLFGVVPQDAFLFNESIEENIRFGNLHATQDEIRYAAALAGADQFIEKLPSGYQTIIGEKGYKLSGGEKQRLSLAQALIRDPEILVLDEATSHLDSSSEQMIQETLKLLRKQKTLLIVAHRLATIQMADLIFVLENGRLIEKGTHQDLLKLGGRYHMFWNLQTNFETIHG